jgi:hypothetical protein
MPDEHGREDGERTVDRRRLLRRAGTVAAGVAGAGVVGAAVAPPAEAAAGDAVLLGRQNDAGPNITAVTGSGRNAATLALGNTAVVSEADHWYAPPLQLRPSLGILAPGFPAGSISADRRGTLHTAVELGVNDYTEPAFVYTNASANITVPLPVSVRAVDTRIAAGRANILNPSGNLDSAGRLLANHSIDINLSSYVAFGLGVLGNLTVLVPIGNGFATVYPYGFARPTLSSISFMTGNYTTNFFTAALGSAQDNDPTDAVSIYSSSTAHIVLDVTGFIVGSHVQVLVDDAGHFARRQARAVAYVRDHPFG